MARRASGGGRRSAAAGRGSTAETWAAGRRLYLDNLKVLLIAAVIAGHAVMGYSELDWWSYADVRETTLSTVTVGLLFVVVLPFALFVVPLLFLVAGLLTPPSLERKGVGRFVRDRLLRLGVPFAVFALLLWPLLEYALFRVLGNTERPYPDYLREEGTLDTGVLWFIGALLTFSLAYAGWVHVRGERAVPSRGRAVRAGHLFLVAAAVTVAAFLLRLVVAFEDDTPYLDLNVYQWPASAGLFVLGILLARSDWLSAVPDRVRRQCRTMTALTVVAFGAFAVYGISSGGAGGETWGGGWHWPAVVFALLESVLAVFGSVWLLATAQRHLDRPFRWARPAVARSAYGAFMLQGVVLFGLAVALRPLPLPAEVKALVVAGGGVAGSFGLAWLLIDRLPRAGRVL